MADDAAPQAEAIPQPRPTAWVTGGGALTYQSSRRRSEPLRPSELPAVGAAGEDAALLYDVVATAELDAARTPPSTDDDADALALMALSRS